MIILVKVMQPKVYKIILAFKKRRILNSLKKFSLCIEVSLEMILEDFKSNHTLKAILTSMPDVYVFCRF